MVDNSKHDTDSTPMQGETVPRPDPTKLTTEQLNTAIESLKELMYLRMELTDLKVSGMDKIVLGIPHEIDTRVDHLRGFIESRLVGMDKATELLQAAHDRLPSHFDEKLLAIKELIDERFTAVNTRFNDRVFAMDKANDLAARNSSEALAAALRSAKDAVTEQNKASQLAIDKSENATHEQLNQIRVLIETSGKATDSQINDLKGRVDRTEGSDSGKHSNAVNIFAIVAMIVSIISVLILAGTVIAKH